MEDPTPIIERSELVTDHFGYWPSFLDAELERLVLSTGDPERERVHLEAALHAFEMTSEVDERGCYVLRKHCRVRFRFERVLEVAVEGFDNQNSLHEAGSRTSAPISSRGSSRGSGSSATARVT